MVDFNGIKPFIPKKIYRKIWEDNHNCMLER